MVPSISLKFEEDRKDKRDRLPRGSYLMEDITGRGRKMISSILKLIRIIVLMEDPG